jgi:hypothetical protein
MKYLPSDSVPVRRLVIVPLRCFHPISQHLCIFIAEVLTEGRQHFLVAPMVDVRSGAMVAGTHILEFTPAAADVRPDC